MTPRHRVSKAAIALIKRFEGYRRKAARLPDGRWTIGHGHTLTARQGAEVGEDDAEALLIYDLIAVAHVLNEQVYIPLTRTSSTHFAPSSSTSGSTTSARPAC